MTNLDAISKINPDVAKQQIAAAIAAKNIAKTGKINSYTSLGSEVQRVRLSKGWSQRTLAKQAHRSPTTIQRAEKYGAGSISTLISIANALGAKIKLQ